MTLSASILTQIFEDEATGKMRCGMRRFTEEDETYLQLDWTASGLVVVDAVALCDDVPLQVLDKEAYSQLTQHERLSAGMYCCKEALVDVHGEPHVVPVEDAPQHFTNKHQIDNARFGHCFGSPAGPACGACLSDYVFGRLCRLQQGVPQDKREGHLRVPGESSICSPMSPSECNGRHDRPPWNVS